MSLSSEAASDQVAALLEILARLDAAGYDFVTPNRSTVRRWTDRGAPAWPDLRDVFGWGFGFAPRALDPGLLEALHHAGALIARDEGLACTLRAARVEGRLFLHSAYPGAPQDSVFVGPDSYRFAACIRREIGGGRAGAILDVGAGAGVGAIVAGALAPGARVLGTDVNPAALRLAAANADHGGVSAQFRLADGLPDSQDRFDLILANPPYVAGTSGSVYKDGGGDLGEGLALDWAGKALDRLQPGGRLLLYTGSPVLAGGRDLVRQRLSVLADKAGASLRYEELDPDIFGGELRREPYARVERIAAVAAVVTRPG